LMRPLGALFFSHIGDRRGRRHMMLMSVAMMTAAMLAIALLPTRSAIGPAAGWLLLLLRFRLVVAAGVTLATIFLPALTHHAQFPLTDSWGLALEIIAFANVALSCDTGASWTLPRLVGRAKAIELLYFPSTIPAATALELGLATSVVPDDQLGAEVATLAAKLAAGPTLSYASMRQSVNFSSTHDLPESLAFEADQMNLTGASEDHRNAVSAFVAKEKPSFRGR